MRTTALVLYLLCTSLSSFAQKPERMPEPPGFRRDYPALNDSILKGKKWYADLSELQDPKKLILFREPRFENYIHFTDDKDFVLNVNEKDCKCTLKGTYDIQLNEAEAEVMVITLQSLFQMFQFTSDKNNPECVQNLIRFLENFSLTADYYESVHQIVITRSEEPAVHPVR